MLQINPTDNTYTLLVILANVLWKLGFNAGRSLSLLFTVLIRVKFTLSAAIMTPNSLLIPTWKHQHDHYCIWQGASDQAEEEKLCLESGALHMQPLSYYQSFERGSDIIQMTQLQSHCDRSAKALVFVSEAHKKEPSKVIVIGYKTLSCSNHHVCLCDHYTYIQMDHYRLGHSGAQPCLLKGSDLHICSVSSSSGPVVKTTSSDLCKGIS